MALSKSVEESLNEASAHIRNALSYAARQERPVVCTQIAKILSDIDSIGSIENILDTLDNTISELED
jgi:benzoyl-CoA reductase/2-hydroxyglutaryl-CoA dehydratase subunit BcrC/BadD/HgdB